MDERVVEWVMGGGGAERAMFLNELPIDIFYCMIEFFLQRRLLG